MSSVLQTARAKAAQADFPAMLSLCQQLRTDPAITLEQLLDVGNLLGQFGFLSEAEGCYRQGLSLSPNDLRPWVNLANLARDRGDHASARSLYERVHRQLPDHPILRRNLLVGLEYDPAATEADRLNAARAWGEWAIVRTGGPPPRPALKPLRDRPLRLGYVSADLCQHTVGLLLKPVLAAHDPTRVTVFAYSAGTVKDWVSREIAASCRATGGQCHAVTQLDDTALAQRIQADQIDLLIDLSGHTAGSRLSVFAQRPAPVQVSWLGYFALWARVLQAVPDSRLILKWRTFNDAALKAQVNASFQRHGLAAERLELRGPAFHQAALQEYADLDDIALDPFPFTGGLTSCEALWMGVPVITWPQGRVVSRQTHALLHQIGLPELSASDADEVVRLARELAADSDRLRALRQGLRARMQASALMDAVGFARGLEEALIGLYRRIEGFA